MTDNEIIKALEYCSIDKNCCDCPYFCGNITCMDKRDKDVLNLINRQKAEIEKLKSEQDQFADIGKMYSEIKSKAIKEFAEKLVAEYKTTYYLPNDDDLIIVAKSDMYNLVKEIVGDKL